MPYVIGPESIFVLESLAIAAFAISGVIGALRKRMDIVGICVALCVAAGGASYVLLIALESSPWVAMTTCAGVTIGLRTLAIYFDFTLPPTGKF